MPSPRVPAVPAIPHSARATAGRARSITIPIQVLFMPREPCKPEAVPSSMLGLGKEGAMQIGMIGLGRMGGNMVRRLLRGGHECVAFDRNPKAVAELVAEGGAGSGTLD